MAKQGYVQPPMPGGGGVDLQQLLAMLGAQYQNKMTGIGQAGFAAPGAPGMGAIGPNLQASMAPLQGLLAGGGSPAEGRAAQGLFSSIGAGAQGVLGASAGAAGATSGAYGTAADMMAEQARMAALQDYMQGGISAEQSLLGQQGQQQGQQNSDALAAIQSFMQANPNATPEQLKAYEQAISGALGIGTPPSWMGTLGQAYGGGSSGLDPSVEGMLGQLMFTAYKQGKSSYADVHQYVTNALIQGDPTNQIQANPTAYLQQQQQIDQYLENLYRQTNAQYGPGGTAALSGDTYASHSAAMGYGAPSGPMPPGGGGSPGGGGGSPMTFGSPGLGFGGPQGLGLFRDRNIR